MTVSAGPKVDMDFFEENGYLVVNDVFDQALDIEPLVSEYNTVLDRLIGECLATGAMTSSYSDLPFDQRLTRTYAETGNLGFQSLDISLPSKGVTAETPMHAGPAVFNLLTNPRLLDIVEQFIGPEILSNPIQHVRIKPPEALVPNGMVNSLLTASTWHQDQGVALPEVDATNMLTVWVAVTDATIENGCLCAVPGSHKRGLAVHCPAGPNTLLHIPDEIISEAGESVPLPVRSGGVVFFHRQTMHASLTNESDSIRWSFDLRYQPIGQPTGRPLFPAFVARSRRDPASEVKDWRVWADMWDTTRARAAEDPAAFAVKKDRWDGNHPLCA